ncbi:MAG: hypothetical protein V7754_18430 [Halioglobus sp.]
MPTSPLLPSAILIASLLLQACATAPVETASVETASVERAPVESAPRTRTTPANGDVPELTLNFPEQDCRKVEQDVYDFTPLERGFTALAAGEYVEAVQHFKRYQRLEKTPEADLEASIAIAYVSILPASPFYDTEEARKSYRVIHFQDINHLALHEQTLLMRQSLETFLLMEKNTIQIKKDNAKLKKDLAKREEALKRLRELTLGQ